MPVYIFRECFKTKPDRPVKEPLMFVFLLFITAVAIFMIYQIIKDPDTLGLILIFPLVVMPIPLSWWGI